MKLGRCELERKFWEEVAPKWNNEIFDTLAEDRGGVISGTIHGLARHGQIVADFGCGVGRYMPLLSANFQRVFALDWATACLQRARLRARRFPNVEVLRTSPRVLAALSCKCDVTVAVHVATHPRQKARQRMLSQAVSLTRRGGWLLIVTPSLESAHYAEAVRRILHPNLKSDFGFGKYHVSREPGVLALGGQPTKHYIAEEILLLLRMLGCVPIEPRRVEYSWRIHSAGVPRRFAASRPWDWLVLAQRE